MAVRAALQDMTLETVLGRVNGRRFVPEALAEYAI